MGKSCNWRTTWSRSLARRRCSQNGVRLPPRRPGSSRARAAFWRNCAPKTAELGSSRRIRSRASLGAILRHDVQRKIGVGSREAQQDAVVVALHLHLDARALAQRAGQRQAPRPVDPPAETASGSTMRGSPSASSNTSTSTVRSDEIAPAWSSWPAT